jgi:nucleoside phosphorylase
MHASHRVVAVGAALAWEVDAALAALCRCGEAAVLRPRRTVWLGTVGRYPILVYRTGVGLRSAQATTRRILREHEVAFVLNTGCAGALTTGWSAGDLVTAQAILSPPPACDRWAIPPPIHQMISQLATANGRTAHSGVILTSRLPLLTGAQKEECGQTWSAHAVEMEGAGVARAAADASCGFASVRAILDPMHTDLPAIAPRGSPLPAATRQQRRNQLSPHQVLRAAVLHHNQRLARASLQHFLDELFAALRRGTIDLDLLGLR